MQTEGCHLVNGKIYGFHSKKASALNRRKCVRGMDPILNWVSNVSYANCCQIECTWLCARLLSVSAKNRKGLHSFCQIVVHHIFLWWCKLCSRASPDKKDKSLDPIFVTCSHHLMSNSSCLLFL